MAELLAPAGNRQKLDTAFHFGADAVYIGGGSFGLRAYAENFSPEEMADAVKFARSIGKKVYVTVNIFASDRDFAPLRDYIAFLKTVDVDAFIVTDPGVIGLCKKIAPEIELHLSTQANTTNLYSVKFWASQGVRRVNLARELSLDEVKEIKDAVGDGTEIEVFVHGAMCISYSGRCLLSSYLTDRDSNRGECVQACRWEYAIAEKSRRENPLTITEDDRGTYILNSKDMNMLAHIGKLLDAGVDSLKIEGRMKSEYYVGGAVNAYRRALDLYQTAGGKDFTVPAELINELEKISHRGYTPGLYFGRENSVCSDTSKPECGYKFIAQVLKYDEDKKAVKVEQRNRFRVGDELEILSADENFNKTIKVQNMYDEQGNAVTDAKLVQQTLYIPCEYRLEKYDILRKAD